MRKNKQILRKIILITTLIIILCIIVLGIIIYNNKIEQDKQYTIEIEQKNKLAEQEQEKERKENIIDSKTREELRKKFETKEERKKIKEITDKIAKDEKNAELYYERGERYSYVYEYKKAYDDFTKAIELNPNKAIYYVGRAGIYNDKEKKKAEEDIGKSLELPYDLETYKKIGHYYTMYNEYESAIEIYKKALLMKLSDKEKMDLYQRLEKVYKLNFDNKELLKLAEMHIKRFTKDDNGYYFKAEAYKMVYDIIYENKRIREEEFTYEYDEVIKVYTEGIKKASKKYDLYLGRGDLYYNIGKFSKSEKDYIEAIKLVENSTEKKQVYYNIAVLYDETGKNDKAIEYYKKTIDEDINRSEVCEKSYSIESCKALIKIYNKNKETENMKEYEELLKELEKYHRILIEETEG